MFEFSAGPSHAKVWGKAFPDGTDEATPVPACLTRAIRQRSPTKHHRTSRSARAALGRARAARHRGSPVRADTASATCASDGSESPPYQARALDFRERSETIVTKGETRCGSRRGLRPFSDFTPGLV